MVKWPDFKFPPINLWILPQRDIKKHSGEPRHKIDDTGYQYFKGFTNEQCEFYPCHNISDFRDPSEFNCLFCNCPLYWLECPGVYTVITDADGVRRKDCTDCKLPHDGYDRSWKIMNLTKWQKQPVFWNGK